MTTVITSSTSAVQSPAQSISAGEIVAFAYTGTLGATEYIDLQYSTDGGGTWKDMYLNGTQVRISTTNNVVTVTGPLICRLDKDASAIAAGAIRFN